MSNPPSQANPGLGPLLPAYDPAGHQTNVALRVTNVTVDTSVTPNVLYGDLVVNASVSVSPPTDLNATGTISAAQPTIGTPIANATVVLALGTGQSSWKGQLLAGTGGFTSGTTIVADKSLDGGITWFATSFKVAGQTPPVGVSSVVGPGPLELTGNDASATHIRLRCSVLNAAETIAVTLHSSVGTGEVSIIGAASTNADTASGTTASSRFFTIGGKTNDGTAQYQPLPMGAGGRSLIIEGFTGGTGVPVTGAFWPTLGTNTMSNAGPVTIATDDTVIGATTATAVVGDNSGSVSAKLRGLNKIWNDVWDSVNHLFAINVKQIGGQAAAMAGSDGQTAANVPEHAIGIYNGSTIDRLVGLNGVAAFQDWVRYQTLMGKSYNATTGKLTSLGTSPQGFQLFNPASSGKSILIYSILILYNSANAHDMRMTTADISTITGWTNANMSITNNKGGSSAGVATANYTTTVLTGGLLGSSRETTGTANNTPIETLTNGECILLPASASINGIAIYMTTGAAANLGITISYLEY